MVRGRWHKYFERIIMLIGDVCEAAEALLRNHDECRVSGTTSDHNMKTRASRDLRSSSMYLCVVGGVRETVLC